MARKPESQLSPAYRRRLERGRLLHPGATTQQLRGKRPQEHIIRREREQQRDVAAGFPVGDVRSLERAFADTRQRVIDTGSFEMDDQEEVDDAMLDLARRSPPVRARWLRAIKVRNENIRHYRRDRRWRLGADGLAAQLAEFWALGLPVTAAFFWYH